LTETYANVTVRFVAMLNTRVISSFGVMYFPQHNRFYRG